jgi:hypothetical protein
MKLRVCILAALVLITAATAYVSGRWAFFLIVPPMIIPGLLALFVSLVVVVPRTGDSSVWNQRYFRFSSLAFCWLLLLLPSLFGDGYFQMGRRAHVRSLFSAELVADVRVAASKLAARKDQFGRVTLTDADLPSAVGGTSWRFPGNASCSFDEESRLTSVELIWGGALISHHGIVISDEPVPFHGSGMHFTEDQGRDIIEYAQRYYLHRPGSYILIDAH